MVCLVICEKNNAAQRVAAILSKGSYNKTYVSGVPVLRFPKDGKEWAVIGMRGHILNYDYPAEFKNWKLEDLPELVKTAPIKNPTAGRIISALRHMAKETDEVIVATDFDREGELIGAEAVSVMGLPSDFEIKRAKFSALTGPEVANAFENILELDENLATAAETRQIVDLAWGAVLTRFMSTSTGKLGSDFLSVGRVQSPTLALVVDREREIEGFKPTPFWEIMIDMEKGRHFFAVHEEERFWDKDRSDEVLNAVKDEKEAKVLVFDSETKAERPFAPFNTTQFLSEANRLGIAASRAMSIAEGLYNDGLLSYPRTDNTVYPPSLPLKRILEELKKSDFRKEAEEILAQPKLRPSRGSKQTTDHPPIHPAGAATNDKLKGDAWRIYELVTQRFLATLAPDAQVKNSNARFGVNGEVFKASGHEILEPGWMKYYPLYQPKESMLPDLEVGERVNIVGIRAREGETKPPSRYSQGRLIQEMERLGLGTKSTRHEIVQKLYDRSYVEGTTLRPTTMGRAVIQSLEDHADMVTKPDMTKQLEDDMTGIEEGKKKQSEVVGESQDMLASSLEVLFEHKDGIRQEVNEALKDLGKIGECPQCGQNLVVRKSRKGKRFAGCSGYPDCTNTYPLPQYGSIQPHDETCDTCKGPQIRLLAKRRRPELVCLDMECKANKKRRNNKK